jgi:hypothetical protein
MERSITHGTNRCFRLGKLKTKTTLKQLENKITQTMGKRHWLKFEPEISLQQIISNKIHNKKIMIIKTLNVYVYTTKPIQLPKKVK